VASCGIAGVWSLGYRPALARLQVPDRSQVAPVETLQQKGAPVWVRAKQPHRPVAVPALQGQALVDRLVVAVERDLQDRLAPRIGDDRNDKGAQTVPHVVARPGQDPFVKQLGEQAWNPIQPAGPLGPKLALLVQPVGQDDAHGGHRHTIRPTSPS